MRKNARWSNRGRAKKDVPDFSKSSRRRLEMSGINPEDLFSGAQIRPDIALCIVQNILEGHMTCESPEASLRSALEIAKESLPKGKEKEGLIAKINKAIENLKPDPGFAAE